MPVSKQRKNHAKKALARKNNIKNQAEKIAKDFKKFREDYIKKVKEEKENKTSEEVKS